MTVRFQKAEENTDKYQLSTKPVQPQICEPEDQLIKRHKSHCLVQTFEHTNLPILSSTAGKLLSRC